MEASSDTRTADRPGYRFELTRHVDAPRALVFAALAEGPRQRRWCAPEGFTVTDGAGDFREGGAWHCEMTGADGALAWVEGVYLEIDPGRRIAQSQRRVAGDGPRGPEYRVEFTLSDREEGTRLGLGMGPFADEATRDLHRAGWAEALARLDARLSEMIAADPAPAGEPVIRLIRIFPHPPRHVWSAWSEAGALGEWWGPDGFTTTTHAFDFRENGVWQFTMHGPEGRNYPNRIRFVTVDPARHLAYRHQGEDEVEDSVFDTDVTFAAVPEGTRLTLTMRFASVEVRDNVARTFGAIEGGKRTLGRLGAWLDAAAA
ncbi:SRPBCC family protein [Amaricoccus solimangrovi]|uniref:Activator of Hsp90 ATPase homologue 1/2-like C-terminal domain-containing protein n=1 Tax=Amaricoccus solimangrovi TaxID=2589815 RepID=A0A501X0G2_9RHOB|nr:SRPBCC family protein [Amaricoccus solimangrovi]TPE52196.1 hypothetical protein FJM51_07180 [Amaricoccus solimangrovi]